MIGDTSNQQYTPRRKGKEKGTRRGPKRRVSFYGPAGEGVKELEGRGTQKEGSKKIEKNRFPK